MCICGGLVEAAAVGAVAAAIIKRKAMKKSMPSMVEMVSRLRAGVKPGQVFKDKRKKARVNERASLKKGDME